MRPDYYEKLLEIVSKKADSDKNNNYTEEIRESKSPEILAALSKNRTNVISFLPVRNDNRVLEVNSHFGELSEYLSEKSGLFYSLVHSEEEMEIVKRRCNANTEIRVIEPALNASDFQEENNNFSDHKPSDEIMISKDYLNFDYIIYTVEDMLSLDELSGNIHLLTEFLSSSGKLVVISDNRLGISRWVSSSVDDAAANIENIRGREDKSERIGFSKLELDSMISGLSGFQKKIFYPYPNRIFSTDIYSDAYLPHKGISFTSVKAYDKDLLEYHFKPKAEDAIIEEGLFPLFSDSMLYIISKAMPDDISNLDYLHFTDRRNPEFNTVTKLSSFPGGKKEVVKTCFDDSSKEFVLSLEKKYTELSEIYSDTNVIFNKAENIHQDSVKLDYITLSNFESTLDEMIFSDKKQEVLDSISWFFDSLKKAEGSLPFEVTPEFNKVFGNGIENNESATFDFSQIDDISLKVSDIDAIFGNAYMLPDGKIEIVDFEWTFDFPVPVKFIEYRCLFYFFHYRTSRKDFLGDNVYSYFGISDEEIRIFAEMETSFQHYVADENVLLKKEDFRKSTVSFESEYNRLKKFEDYLPIIKEYKTVEKYQESALSVKVYFDRGQGFSEDDSIVINPFIEGSSRVSNAGGRIFEVSFDIPEGVRIVRIDPASAEGIFELSSLQNENGKKLSPKFINMKKIDKEKMLSINNDPQMIIKLHSGATKISMKYSFDVLIRNS